MARSDTVDRRRLRSASRPPGPGMVDGEDQLSWGRLWRLCGTPLAAEYWQQQHGTPNRRKPPHACRVPRLRTIVTAAVTAVLAVMANVFAFL